MLELILAKRRRMVTIYSYLNKSLETLQKLIYKIKWIVIIMIMNILASPLHLHKM